MATYLLQTSRYAGRKRRKILLLIAAIALDSVFVTASSSKHLYTLHFRDPVHPRPDRRQRLLPRFPCEPKLDAGPYSRKDRRDSIASVRWDWNIEIRTLTDMARLWVTDPLSPSSSGPPTPSHSTAHIPLATPNSGATVPNTAVSPPPSPLPQPTTSIQAPDHATPHLPTPPQPFTGGLFSHSSGVTPPLAPSVPASSLPGARLSGRLVGVVSLTDILNLHARATGLSPADPDESRRRRRSSSSSMNLRRSGEVGRELFSRGGM